MPEALHEAVVHSVSSSSAITWAITDAAVMRSTGLSTGPNHSWAALTTAGSAGSDEVAQNASASHHVESGGREDHDPAT